MTTDYIYNPVTKSTEIERLKDALPDIYYGSAVGQFAVELSFFVIGCAVVAGIAAAFTA